MSGAAVLAAARGAIGARFRPQGRDPATGLDCVGLAALALGRAAPRGYRLRSDDVGHAVAALEAAGLVPAAEPRAGDLLLCRSGPGQLHLAIRSEDGIVHADAMARRVVERPGPVPWPVLGCFRLREDN
ncbi:hypothetical protein [Sphingomonas elodea]|uniref:hypothetical protein n=1 Tax=Sphingomonas elodea TaxID=179878 RepID=UPI0002631377|nr:hypothetical protein [Sphingomonas elodea]